MSDTKTQLRAYWEHLDELFPEIALDDALGTDAAPRPAAPAVPRPPRPWWKRPITVTVAAAVAVLLAVGATTWLLAGDTTVPPADTSPSTTPPVVTTAAPQVTTTTEGAPATTVVAPATTAAPAPPEATEPPIPPTPAGWELIKPVQDGEGAFEGIVAGDAGFVATGGGGGTGVWTSPDGIEWTEVGDVSDPVGLGVGVDILDVAVNGDRIAAVIHNGWDAVAGVATTTDTEDWTFAPLAEFSGAAEPDAPSSITPYGTDGFVVAGGAIWKTNDGKAFELVHEGIGSEFWTSAADGRTAVVGTSEGELLVTRDGETWEQRPRLAGVLGDGEPCPRVSLEALVHGSAGFVAVGGCGQFGTAWTSPDGFVWTQIPHDPTAFGDPAWIPALAATERGYVAGGHSGPEGDVRVPTVWTSSDGVGWTRTVLDGSVVEVGGVLGVAIHEDTLVAVGWIGNEAAIWTAELD